MDIKVGQIYRHIVGDDFCAEIIKVDTKIMMKVRSKRSGSTRYIDEIFTSNLNSSPRDWELVSDYVPKKSMYDKLFELLTP